MKLKSILQKQDRAEGGLSIFLSVIVMVFIIGLLVMIFALMGGELKDATTDTTADEIIGNTTASISDAVDWFPLFIVIAAMVAIILLTVLIIVAIRGSGLMESAA